MVHEVENIVVVWVDEISDDVTESWRVSKLRWFFKKNERGIIQRIFSKYSRVAKERLKNVESYGFDR